MRFNIRIESFGATVFDLKDGKRSYFKKEELVDFLGKNILPRGFDMDINCEQSYKIIRPKLLFENGFSFADTIFIELTRACNLRCKHCLNSSGEEIKNSLKVDEVIKLIADLSAAGVQEIRFTGGEPLLFNGIEDCIKIANSLGLKTSLGTNGTLLSEEKISLLKKSGLDQIVISLDGTREVHDGIRGMGNFDKTIKGLTYSLNKGIDVRVNSVIMKNNKYDVIELAKELDKKGIKLFIRRFIQTGRAQNLPDLELGTNEYNEVKQLLNNELNRNVQGHGLKNNNGTDSRIRLSFEIDTCRAGKRTLDITPEGNIYPCGFLAAQGYPPLGNVREISDWNKFWYNLQKDESLNNLRSRMNSFNSKNLEKCTCLAKFYRMEGAKKC